MAHHPSPIVIHIVGTEVADDARSCEEHVCCGAEVLDEDVVVRLRKVQVVVDGREETAIAAVWVTDGVDRCRVGYLQRHFVANAARFDGALAQITKVLSKDDGDTAEKRLFHKNKGCSYATIITTLPKTKVKEEKEEKDEGEDDNKEVGKKRTAACIALE
jgi:Fe-S cluster assembly iron-binding protein IscA